MIGGVTTGKILGVEFKQLKTFPDDRGFFRELVRHTDDFFGNRFGQWSHSKMSHNTVKAWHYHHLQTDWWYVGIGVTQTVLIDNRAESPTYRAKLEFKMGDAEVDPEALACVVRIPPGVLHGCKTLTEYAHLFYITSQTYDPADEGRIPFNTPGMGHNWGDESALITSPKDRVFFEPGSPRELLTS